MDIPKTKEENNRKLAPLITFEIINKKDVDAKSNYCWIIL